jgi:hypothetical protein
MVFDNRSILWCFQSDGTLDIAIALEQLNDDSDNDDDSQLDEPSILQCIKSDGGLDVSKFRQFQDAALLFELTLLKEAGLMENDNSPTGGTMVPAAVRCFTRRHTHTLLHQVWGGDCQHQATPQDSLWWKMYVQQPMLNIPKFHRCFCNHFWMPYKQYVQFISNAKESSWFPHWEKHNSTSPIELLILGGFQYLGQGWTFDDLEENTLISCEVHQNNFHEFIVMGANILYPLYVLTPTTVEDCQTHMHEFMQVGFNGTIGSTDATHVAIEKCSYRHDGSSCQVYLTGTRIPCFFSHGC